MQEGGGCGNETYRAGQPLSTKTNAREVVGSIACRKESASSFAVELEEVGVETPGRSSQPPFHAQ